mgnify:CR=1 FL=1
MKPTENKHIEYKQKVTPEIEKEVVAFLNSNKGGLIYIGLDKSSSLQWFKPSRFGRK